MTTMFQGTAGNSRLQTRPALQLAVGQLPSSEQSLVQIALRVLGPHLKVPCEAVVQPQADITAQPVGSDKLELTTRYAQRHVERPVRLSPLSDALSDLIEDLLQREASDTAVPSPPATAPTAVNAPPAQAAAMQSAARGDGQPLLDFLLLREQTGPVRLTLNNGMEIFVDQRYHTAWTSERIESLPDALGDRTIQQQQQIGVVDFLQRTGKGNPVHSILVEQLCWMLPSSPATQHLLARWHQSADASFSLETWPNLSSQADMLAWLPVLTAASRAPLMLRDAMRIAERNGISAERARNGISLLFLFKHAALRTAPSAIAAEANTNVVAPMSTAENKPVKAPSTGLLSRLRSRLRHLMD